MSSSPFIEGMVIKRKDNRDRLIMLGILLASALLIFLMLKFLPMRYLAVGMALIVAIGYGIYYGIKMLYVEYEYSLTLGCLDVDRIRGERKRTRLFSGELSDIDEMVPFDPHRTYSETIVAAVSSPDDEGIYTFAFTKDGKRQRMLFQPTLEMLAAARKYMGRKLTLTASDEIKVAGMQSDTDDVDVTQQPFTPFLT